MTIIKCFISYILAGTMTLSILAIGRMTLNITSFTMMTLRIAKLSITVWKQRQESKWNCLLSGLINASRHFGECRSAECRGASFKPVKCNNNILKLKLYIGTDEGKPNYFWCLAFWPTCNLANGIPHFIKLSLILEGTNEK